MPTPTLRLTADVSGTTRKLCSFALRKNGDLVIDLKPAPNHRAKAESAKVDAKVVSDRWSIHRSLKSPDGNLITKTRILSNGTHMRYQQFTRALKLRNQFAAVFYRRYPWLNNPEIELDDGSQDRVALGPFDESKFNLIVGLFVGNADRHFIPFRSQRWRIHQRQFGDFNLVFLVSFLSLSAVLDGDLVFPFSSKEGEPHDVPFGYSELEATAEFERICSHLKHLYILKAIEALNPKRDEGIWDEVGQFFADGLPDASKEIKAHLAKFVLIDPTGRSRW